MAGSATQRAGKGAAEYANALAIIPVKQRVADRYYDPVRWVLRKLFGK
jgi:hypothetical protein